ncbi:TetR family transcriptional regulator [Nonomuraea sp. NPDC005650]|uniref:TetR/AcrR family transcriptional regulator n=1 Tax=Nonomuraea sp. NPDC005650 TaxID=3157045 RepID=UPI0033B1E162
MTRSSIEGIARRAGTSKQTIYRWWPSRAAVLSEAFEEVLGDQLVFPDTGDLVANLRTQMTSPARSSRRLRGMEA